MSLQQVDELPIVLLPESDNELCAARKPHMRRQSPRGFGDKKDEEKNTIFTNPSKGNHHMSLTSRIRRRAASSLASANLRYVLCVNRLARKALVGIHKVCRRKYGSRDDDFFNMLDSTLDLNMEIATAGTPLVEQWLAGDIDYAEYCMLAVDLVNPAIDRWTSRIDTGAAETHCNKEEQT
jgi:hypothetical protein